MASEIGIVEFEELVKTDKLIVLDFWAEWCGPCRNLSPIIEELSNEYSDSVNIKKVNVDENPDMSQKFGIRNLPTVLFIKNGEVLDKQVGFVPKIKYIEKINNLLN
jgi:thioredoxin 1